MNAIYYDGRFAKQHPVTLAIDGDMFVVSGDGIDRRDPLGAVQILEALGRTPRIVRLVGGASCEIGDVDAFAQFLSAHGIVDSHVARWDRNWRNNNRYDWRSYRNSNRVVFRIGTYYSPYRSYSYRRLSSGFYLDSLFYGNRYWINDPWQYRLPAVYGPYRWVRYYDDVLLVDIYSGQVVDVIYDFFW